MTTGPDTTMSDGALGDRLRGIFSETLNVEVGDPDTDLIESGLLDSLALVELLFALEEAFGVSVVVDELDLEELRTLDSIARLVARLRAGQDVQAATPGP